MDIPAPRAPRRRAPRVTNAAAAAAKANKTAELRGDFDPPVVDEEFNGNRQMELIPPGVDALPDHQLSETPAQQPWWV